MKILITAFDAFGGETINPSELVVEKLPNVLLGHKIIKKVLPTAFKESSKILEKTLVKVAPDIVIHLGQAGGRNKISIERVAINIDDARIKDNLGNQPVDEIIRYDGDSAYFSTLPIKRIVQTLKDNSISAEISNSAGTFVCNHIMYDSLYFTKNTNIRSGFIHIPYVHEQVKNKPQYFSMDLDSIVKAIIIVIETVVTFNDDNDIKINAGKEF